MKKFFYRVEENDTVMSVANRFSVPLFYLIETNNLVAEISKGDLLYVETDFTDLYTVKATDTEDMLATKFNLDKAELLEKNKAPYFFVGLKIIV